MRIGIFGGSFNPVHRGHLKLAREAMSELNLNEIIFVPSRRNPLKKEDNLLPVRIRMKRLQDAIKNNPHYFISWCELNRAGKSYTVDTLKFFKRRLKSGDVLYFLAGADTLQNLLRWKRLGKIFTLCRFVAASRPGYSLKEAPPQVLKLPMDAVDLSSTAIRGARAKKKRSL